MSKYVFFDNVGDIVETGLSLEDCAKARLEYGDNSWGILPDGGGDGYRLHCTCHNDRSRLQETVIFSTSSNREVATDDIWCQVVVAEGWGGDCQLIENQVDILLELFYEEFKSGDSHDSCAYLLVIQDLLEFQNQA